MQRVYCQPCWLFSDENVSPGTSCALQNLWSATSLNDWRHLSQRIQSHERSTHHTEVSYMSNGETGEQQKKRCTSLLKFFIWFRGINLIFIWFRGLILLESTNALELTSMCLFFPLWNRINRWVYLTQEVPCCI